MYYSGTKTITSTSTEAENLTGTSEDNAKAHKNDVFSISFSPDGSMLASVSDDNTIKLWAMPEGKFLKNLVDSATLVQEKENVPTTPSNTLSTSDGGGYSGGSYCTCNRVCTCIPIK